MSFWHSEKTKEFRLGRAFAVPIVLIVLIWLLFSTFVTVPAGSRGVVVELGAVKDRILGEGFHTVTPFVQSIQLMNVRTQKYEVDSSAATKDLLDVNAKIAVNYHLDDKAVNKIFQTLGLQFESNVIAPAVQEVIKSITAKFDAEELITKRAVVSQQIEQTLKERLFERGIVVEGISIVNFEFPKQFNEAITSKQTAVQLKLKAQNDLERIKVEAEQQVATAKGEAEAIRVINEELQKSPQYVNLLAVQKWDGVMPLATGGGVLPFIQIPTQ